MAKTIAEILKETRASHGFNKSEMARKIGIASQLYGQYEKGEVAPKLDFRKKFEDIFGVSLINIENNSSNQESTDYKSQNIINQNNINENKDLERTTFITRKVPIYDAVAIAGHENEADMSPLTAPSEYRYVNELDLMSNCDAVLRVYGNSMVTSYPSGTELALEVNYDNFFVWGEVYVIETRSNRLFKRIYKSKRDGWIKCVSDNTMRHESGEMEGELFYPAFELPLTDIIRKFDVVGLQKRNKNSQVYYRNSVD